MKSGLMILLAYITCVCEMHSNDRMYVYNEYCSRGNVYLLCAYILYTP